MEPEQTQKVDTERCYLCHRDRAGHEKWNLNCAAWAEHDWTPEAD